MNGEKTTAAATPGERPPSFTTYEEELAAMGKVADAMNVLDEGARYRLVSWITARYELYGHRKPGY